MKVFVFLVALVIFVGSLLLMGYAFNVPDPFHLIMFGGGILGVSLSLAIPFHLLEKFD